MTNTTNPVNADKTHMSSDENKKNIEHHKTAAAHLELSAKHHLEAAKHHADGNHEKAAHSTVKAHGHHSLANVAQKEDVKHHVMDK